MRADLAFPLNYDCSYPYITPFIGVAGRFQLVGQRMKGLLIGQNINFNPGCPKNLAEFILEFRSEAILKRAKLYGNFQFLADTHSSTRIFAQAGVEF